MNGEQHRILVSENQEVVYRPGRIPCFASREEEADFWDTHDFTDFIDETEPIRIEYGGSIFGPIERTG